MYHYFTTLDNNWYRIQVQIQITKDQYRMRCIYVNKLIGEEDDDANDGGGELVVLEKNTS